MERNPISLATKIFMIYEKDLDNVFIILEGETDFNLWKDNFSFKLENYVHLDYAGDKDSCIEVLKLIYNQFSKKMEINGVIAIIDADFDHITKKEVFDHSCLFRTDYHDIELMMLSSGAFVKFFKRYCTDIGRIQHILKKFHKVEIDNDDIIHYFHTALLEIPKKLGILRWINNEREFGLSFKNINYIVILKNNLFQIDTKRLIDHIITKNHKQKDFKKKLKELYEKEILIEYDLNQICQGHDVISILTLWVNHLFCKRESNLEYDDIQKFLEGSYEFRFFKESDLYRKLINWQRKYPKFKIFVD